MPNTKSKAKKVTRTSAKTTPRVGRFAGKAFSFAGTRSRYDSFPQQSVERLIAFEGGKVATLSSKTHYLILSRTGTKEARKQAETWIKQEADLKILNGHGFMDMLVDRDLKSLATWMRQGLICTKLMDSIREAYERNDVPISTMGVDLSGAKLKNFYPHVNLKGANLRGAEIVGSHVWHGEGADFTGARILKSSLREAHLAKACFEEATFKSVDFRRADLRGSNFRGATFVDTDLREANLTGAQLSGAKLAHAKIHSAILKEADLSNADLRGAMLNGADLSQAVLDGARFQGANLSGTKLTGGDTSRAHGLVVPDKKGTFGPHVQALEAVIHSSAIIRTSADIRLPDGVCNFQCIFYERTSELIADDPHGRHYRTGPMSPGWFEFTQQWSHGTLSIDSIASSSTKCKTKGKALRKLVVAAWCELLGVPQP